MTNQPTNIRFAETPAASQRLSGGGYVFSPRADGDRITVMWGVDVATIGAYDELITDLGGTPGSPGTITLAHTITWEDPNGNAFSVATVVQPFEVNFGPEVLYRSFSVTFFEVPS